VFSRRTPRIVSAIKLHRRKDRDSRGEFLAEGPGAVSAALEASVVRHTYVTAERAPDYPGAEVVTDDAMAALCETVQPQGVVAVCEAVDIPLAEALGKEPRLVAVLLDIRDPGNAGAVLRTADAAGAGLVIFAGEAVDPYNGKCVRSSAGSLFHVDVVRERDWSGLMQRLRGAGLQTLATSGYAARDLDELVDAGRLAGRTAWVFGSEAHGLPAGALSEADEAVRVPIYGGAESLNLAAAAAVCLYASARAQRT
jgi:RNA methyltransferase, TrmH family